MNTTSAKKVRSVERSALWEGCLGNISDSQSRLNLVNSSDRIDAVSIGDGSVLLASIVTEQEHLLVVEGVLGPCDVRQQAGSRGTARVVGVLMVDEVD